MKFKFNISLDDKEFIDFNVFVLTKSIYGRKTMVLTRIIVALIVALGALVPLASFGFTLKTVYALIPLLVILVVAQVFLKHFITWRIKRTINKNKRSGKMGYSPNSEMEFYDEKFCEVTPDNKTESNYSSVECVSIIKDKATYIHINHAMAYILPASCFNSTEEYEDFISFLKEKCATVNIY